MRSASRPLFRLLRLQVCCHEKTVMRVPPRRKIDAIAGCAISRGVFWRKDSKSERKHAGGWNCRLKYHGKAGIQIAKHTLAGAEKGDRTLSPAVSYSCRVRPCRGQSGLSPFSAPCQRWTMRILGLSRHTNPNSPATKNPLQLRLAEAFGLIEHIQQQRREGHDALWAKFVEERLIWRELLDLELQDVDEQLERICASAAIHENDD